MADLLSLDPRIERVFLRGRDDIGLFAADGFGVLFHDKQLYMLDELEHSEATVFVVFGGNRAGKTLPVLFKHLHEALYKPQLPKPATQREFGLWTAEDYRTLHCAPSNGLVAKHWAYAQELAKGTHPAQRDESGRRREAPVGAMFTFATESVGGSGEHLVIRSLTGGTVDMYSTEGNATRIESMPWRFGSWDEWPLQEAADKATAIRTVLNRLLNRLSDFDGRLLLTGTLTDETEHIGRDFQERADDPDDHDFAAIRISRLDNPYASLKAIGLAERTMEEEDYRRTVLGEVGGVKGRLFPAWMVDPVFSRELPAHTPPHPRDGVLRGEDGRVAQSADSPWTYLHVWDLAISVDDNVGMVLRAPRDWRFSVESPLVGVRRKVVHGSRTLTSDEVIDTITETYLLYGGQIVIDATDAHGKDISRRLRNMGYPVTAFVFNERDERKVLRKEAAILHARELLSEGMEPVLGPDGEPVLDADGVPEYDRSRPYGVLRLPRAWTRTRDQLSVLRKDDSRQRQDEAMTVLMGLSAAYRERRSRTRRTRTTRLAAFAGGRRYGRG